MGSVEDIAALGQVFFEYISFSYQSLFHQLLHNHHHLSSGPVVAAVPSGLSLTPLIIVKKIVKITVSGSSRTKPMYVSFVITY
jgi:hypothetical protein